MVPMESIALSPVREQERVFTVTDLAAAARAALESSFFHPLWVTGEVSNFKAPSSGHWYFTLKDERAQVRCAMFKRANSGLEPPAPGTLVEIFADVSFYEARGDFQLVVSRLRPAGEGALWARFLETKKRLSSEGVFSPERKKPLPGFVRRVGIVTSPEGAAVMDVIRVLRRRMPWVKVVVYPSLVQGKEAISSLVAAMDKARSRADVEVLILARGGGSAEDLWVFNEEEVVRKVAGLPMPVVSAVGHEVDVTLADLAADVRASTPTAAAEILGPDLPSRLETLAFLGRRLCHCEETLLRAREASLRAFASALQSPQALVQGMRLRFASASRALAQAMAVCLDKTGVQAWALESRLRPPEIGPRQKAVALAAERLWQGMASRLKDKGHALQIQDQALEAQSPLAVLERGYALVEDMKGSVVREAKGLSPGEPLKVRFFRGSAVVGVVSVQQED